nr:lysoplasmalogenase family protein [Rubricella aquisinus]
MIVKGCAVSGLILFAVGFGAPLMLIVALGLMFVTDLVLASGAFRTKRLMIIGMITSIAGQGALMLLFAQHWGGLENWFFGLVAILGFGLGILTMLWDEMKKMLFPVMIYISSIAAMAYFSFGLMEPYRLAVYGSVLFIVHAIIHAFEQFHLAPTSPYVRVTAPVIYLLYYGALLIFALAFILPEAL